MVVVVVAIVVKVVVIVLVVVVVVVLVVVVVVVVVVLVVYEPIVLTYRARRPDSIRGTEINLPLPQSVQAITGIHPTSYPLLIEDSSLPE